MPSDIKRIIVTATLAAAAFNATALAAGGALSSPPAAQTASAALPVGAADTRPRRVRIERCQVVSRFRGL